MDLPVWVLPSPTFDRKERPSDLLVYNLITFKDRFSSLYNYWYNTSPSFELLGVSKLDRKVLLSSHMY